ncbi:DNA helicase I [Dyadobacter luteus]|uniref:DNA helicase I n=1 Tax=Dyadobacter luteus TaxID=2259619 RepID=A0A3D8YE74_9BACT|nr:AAA domain-containing protein [Dyadobacter luteus]REA62485.1 DNA helicase I [Dyadobacter luteus]
MNRILKAYLKRLTNLSTRNKSLLLPRLPSEQFLDISELDFLLGKPALDVVVQMIQGAKRIPLCDVQDPRMERVNEVSKKLRKISRTNAFILEERGSQDLYLGYPFVKGKLSDGTPIHAPLLFFPVTLKTDREEWCIFKREEAEVILNRSFALAYAHFNEVVLTDEVLEKSFEDFSSDFLEFRTQLYEWLKQTPFRINFNPDLFTDKLIPFDAKKGAELQQSELNGEIKLFAEAVLGIFPQSGSYLVPDYERLLALRADAEIPLLSADNADYFQPERIREEGIFTPFDLDSSQEKIILSVKAGNSVVVQGPPGSGKSQLICNLMADFAARGKRVLLVCQKRAALDVVYKRLSDIGMGKFTALIHDFKNDRPQLYQQISEQIAQVDAYRQQNYSLDAVFPERQFDRESRQIDKILADLDSFREALFDEKECGVSVKELYLTTDPSQPHVDLLEFYKLFRQDSVEDYKRKLRSFTRYHQRIGKDHIWYDRKSFAGFGSIELQTITKMLSDWPEAFHRQTTAFEQITHESFNLRFIADRNEIVERLHDIRNLIDSEVAYGLFKSYLQSDLNAFARLSFIRQVTDSLEGFIQDEGIEMSLRKDQLDTFRMEIRKVIEAKKSSVTGLWWSFFGKQKEWIQEVTTLNGLSVSVEDLVKLDVKIQNRIQVEGWLVRDEVQLNDQYFNPVDRRENDFLNFFQQAEAAADAAGRASYQNWAPILFAMTVSCDVWGNYAEKLDRLIHWFKTWNKMETAMQVYLLNTQIENLYTEPESYGNRLSESLASDFDLLVDMDTLWAEMTLAEQQVSQLLLSESAKKGIVMTDEIVSYFENSLGLSWIGHIETKYPQLRAVSSLRMSEWEEQIQQSIIGKQELSSQITAIRLREYTYQGIEKNRLGNRVTYRELAHQVTKKRKIWPIRRLIEQHRDEIFSLVPCWMASPESVSAIFPLENKLFDLVIFDEASQCYAEYGLPAAFRGKQIVIAGDSKQLSPSDLYKVRYEEKGEEEEYEPATEVESLLDLGAQSLEQYQLSGHYRSLSLDLIDFSNHHFYKNSLRLLPDFENLKKAEPGIRYEKVEGVWKNNANLVEADRVVELLLELAGKQKTIGVVTFNFFQQQAIQEAVERAGVTIDSLFVKNIENVQGDERDIIIFSMGYAPDEKGKLSMQFGSLNMQGGENRLNVAVTRAREKVYFVTSVLPSQLNTDAAAHAGPGLLKSYMQYAMEVSEGSYKPSPYATDGIRSEWLLKSKLLKMNSSFVRELPFADITVKEEEAYKGLVLTDDELYHRSESSKEPHAYLPLLLRKKHWPFKRVYSRDYWAKNPDQIL